MKIRTQLKAGGIDPQHNESLKVRTALKAGVSGFEAQHNETLRDGAVHASIAMRRQPRTTVSKEDRLELLVIRAGLRAGARRPRERK